MGNISVVLQDIVETNVNQLPEAWNVYEMKFSHTKRLYDFQKGAIDHALRGLKLFYEDFGGKYADQFDNAKSKLYDEYVKFMESDVSILDLNVSEIGKKATDIAFKADVLNYMGISSNHIVKRGKEERVSFKYFVNRMGFWMATGSGKTLVIVELIHSLYKLMEKGLIPKKNILFLTARDDLIEQFKKHIDEYDSFHGTYFELVSLKDFGSYMSTGPLAFKKPIFFYRADNISDKAGDKLIDFRDYENGGNWYVILDEAHKGDKDSSKRQYMYSVFARNGFMFNFSATFDHPIDIASTIFEYNLSTFIQKGHGKHILIFDENVPFREKEVDELSEDKKRRIMLKMLMLLAALRKSGDDIRKKFSEDVYHSPLAMVLVGSIRGNTDKKKEIDTLKQSDMRIFLKLLMEVVSPSYWQDRDILNLIKEVVEDLRKGITQDKLIFDKDVIDASRNVSSDFIKDALEDTPQQILKNIYEHVFNTSQPGSVEIVIPKDSKNQEILFKMKNADKPFALIRAGSSSIADLKKWLIEDIGYEENVDVNESSYFAGLDKNENISLLLGSRSFYEGWDSSRPNIIMFVGIGVGSKGRGQGEIRRKFVLQSIGRGVRIEPLKDKRKRKYFLCEEDNTLPICGLALKDVFPIETLFVWGTSADVIKDIMESMENEKLAEGYPLDFIRENVANEDKSTMYVPVYSVKKVKIPEKPQKKYRVNRQVWDGIRKMQKEGVLDRDLVAFHVGSDIRYVSKKEAIELFFNILGNRDLEDKWIDAQKDYKKLSVWATIRSFFEHLQSVSRLASHEVDIESVDDKITHFRFIRVRVKDIAELKKIEKALSQSSDDIEKKIEEINKEIDEKIYAIRSAKGNESMLYKEQIKKLMKEAQELEEKREKLRKQQIDVETLSGTKQEIIVISSLLTHYYLPVVMSDDEKKQLLKNAITHKSEIDFILELEKFMLDDKQSNSNKEYQEYEEYFDDWKFSKIVENVDGIYIPYFKEDGSGLRKFYPDFVFWFKKEGNIKVVFVDPKGTEHTDAERKIDGYEAMFMKDGKPKVFYKDGNTVSFHLFMFNKEKSSSKKYENYWVSSIPKLFEKVKELFE